MDVSSIHWNSNKVFGFNCGYKGEKSNDKNKKQKNRYTFDQKESGHLEK